MLHWRLAGLVALFVGCGVDVEPRPIRPPPPGFGDPPAEAAAPDGGEGDAGATAIAGSVCVAPTLAGVPGTGCNPGMVDLSGATVSISGTTIGARLDAAGRFSLAAPAGETSVLIVLTPGATGVVPALLRADVPS